MYKINFNHLFYFKTIAENQSIVKASKVLNISQPALSKQLKSLEYDLGFSLFERKGRRLVLNTNGMQVLEYATKVFRDTEEMLVSVNKPTKAKTKEVRIGIAPWLSNHVVYSSLKKLIYNKHLKCSIIQIETNGLINLLESNKLDFILLDQSIKLRSKKLESKLIHKEKIICTTSYKTKTKGRFPTNINDKRFINYSPDLQVHTDINNYLDDHDIECEEISNITDSALIHLILKKTDIIAFLPESIVKNSIKNKELRKLGELDDVLSYSWIAYNPKQVDQGILDLVL